MYHSRLNHNHFDQIRVFVSAAFISLLDNYESDTGEPEIVTPEEVAENHKFLDSIIQTPTMKVPVACCFAKRPTSTTVFMNSFCVDVEIFHSAAKMLTCLPATGWIPITTTPVLYIFLFVCR